ncbi:unnamed protein product [Eruca vesicaria subsp. sativa]|uniref:Uncharacterized protein n=1 Tax=Eruca vesicaria subsp. sativa TaxID=29727 RepID=A0ABC8KSN4_ERUVS|nr:unnamed protein product [Eruca vesicaria subsp. sativa]
MASLSSIHQHSCLRRTETTLPCLSKPSSHTLRNFTPPTTKSLGQNVTPDEEPEERARPNHHVPSLPQRRTYLEKEKSRSAKAKS